ncbi:MAG: DUF2141 domain-containing protein [Terracidiphilus sp.]|jgi:uncharacterized protein (DUF2141 family)
MTSTVLNSKKTAGYAVVCCAGLALSIGTLGAQAPVSPAPAPATAPASAPGPSVVKSTLTIHLTGFRNAKGKVNIALYRDGKGFPMDPGSAVDTQRLEIDAKTLSVTVVFADIPQGSYAVSVLHDENLTGKMDFDSAGIPQKGYGISNNPDTTQGPPTPESAMVSVNQPETRVDIKLVYWQ